MGKKHELWKMDALRPCMFIPCNVTGIFTVYNSGEVRIVRVFMEEAWDPRGTGI